jgi:replicative DNA helicase
MYGEIIMIKKIGSDTKVLMYDKSVKNIQNILTGDKLFGRGFEPISVLSIKKSTGNIYKISPVKGDCLFFGGDSEITLVHSMSGIETKVCVEECITRKLGKYHDHKLFRSSLINFQDSAVVLEPYFAGIWLGDGDTSGPRVTTKDVEIQNYLLNYSTKFGFIEKLNMGGTCPTVMLTGRNGKNNKLNANPIRSELRKFILNDEKYIPSNYLFNSKENRLKLLAGLIDSDGYYHCGYYEITTKIERLSDDILHLCRGLGFAAYKKHVTKTIKSIGFSGKYWRINFSGFGLEDIPCLLERKMAHKRLQKKEPLRTGFSISKVEDGELYELELDADVEILLSDYTVL